MIFYAGRNPDLQKKKAMHLQHSLDLQPDGGN